MYVWMSIFECYIIFVTNLPLWKTTVQRPTSGDEPYIQTALFWKNQLWGIYEKIKKVGLQAVK